MKTSFITLLLFLFVNISYASNPVILIKTTEGDMKVELFEDTPLHTENFLKLVKKHFYDSLLFHRVIKNFMVQTGDPDSKNAKPGQSLGSGGLNYTIPQEFRKEHYHKKGALAAARLGDNMNPMKESSSCQFYIVQGQIFTPQMLKTYIIPKRTVPLTEEQAIEYTTKGGAPHLDYEYTVFGQVIEGLEVIDKIASYQTDGGARPFEDIRILTIKILSK